jgi:adenylate cyclase
LTGSTRRDGVTDADSRGLTIGQVAEQAGVTAEAVNELIEVGALHPDASGLLATADVPRVRLAAALAEGGIDAKNLMWAIRRGFLNLEQFAFLWTLAEPSGRTFAEFQASLGAAGEHLPSIYGAFGLGVPPPHTPMRAEEERLVRRFVDLWTLVDPRPEAAVRAARIAGDGIQRLQLGTIDLFDEFDGSPPARQRRGMASDEANRPSFELADITPQLLVWLLGRHMENEIFDRVVRFIQGVLAAEGLIAPEPDEEPTIAFVDLSGYTELTERLGDASAAESAASLQGLAMRAAEHHRGRVVKLLGDGVMLQYRHCADAVRSSLELMDLVADAGLPPAHAGIATGPLVVRDGDVYGNTVNRASRIASHASTGELLVDRDIADRLRDESYAIDDMGEVSVKGLAEPIGLARVHR